MSIPGSASPLFFQAAAAAAAPAVATKSLRINRADSAHLTRTPSSAGNRRTFTFSAWVKRSHISTALDPCAIFSAGGSSPWGQISFTTDGNKNHLDVSFTAGVSSGTRTSAQFRDVSAWYHIVVAVDTTQATASNRIKMYVNGVQFTDMGNTNYPAQNFDTQFNNTNVHRIGANGNSSAAEFLGGYIADVHFIDGSALDATSFGAFDSNGVWQAAAYSGTFGTNGFHLKFDDASSDSALGTDSSGNSNTFTVNNLNAATAAAVDYSTGQVTGSESGFVSGYGPDKMFDGSLSTLTDQVDTGGTGEAGYLYWNPSTAISVSSKLRIYGRWYVSSIGNQYLISDEVSINGNSYTAPGDGTTSNQWVDLSSYLSSNSITSITNISFRSNPTSSNRLDPAIAAIEVDNTILVNSAATDGDVLFDVPTNGSQSDTGSGGEVSGNYAVFNALEDAALGGNASLSNGNLQIDGSSSEQFRPATIPVSSGKWYFEIVQSAGTDFGPGVWAYPLASPSSQFYQNENYRYNSNGGMYNESSLQASYSSFAVGDVIGTALDMDNGKVYFSKNGTWQNSGDPAAGTNPAATGLTGQWVFGASTNGNSTTLTANWGQKSFSYSAPSGFKALCTTNLPTPTIADGSDYFNTALWTGDGGSSVSVTTGFEPDFIWIKQRNKTYYHQLYDAVRGFGSGKALASNEDVVEGYGSPAQYGYVSATTSTPAGFTGTAGSGTPLYVNENNTTYVAWSWQSGPSTVSNTDGSITSSVRASTTAGFSIVTATQGSGTSTWGHGLSTKPDLIIMKARDQQYHWYVSHSGLDNQSTKFLRLNLTSAVATNSNWFNSTEPTNSVVSTKAGGMWSQGDDFVAYCFSAVSGFSAFGSYDGTGSADGPFLYTNHRPAWILIKCSNADTSTTNWIIWDTKRDPSNMAEVPLRADLTNVEIAASDNYDIDILSNGFKIRTSNGGINHGSRSYVWASFAENPFSANGGLAR